MYKIDAYDFCKNIILIGIISGEEWYNEKNDFNPLDFSI